MADLLVRVYAEEVVVDFTPPAGHGHEVCVPGQYDGAQDVGGSSVLGVAVPGSFGLGVAAGGAAGGAVIGASFGTQLAVPGEVPACEEA